MNEIMPFDFQGRQVRVVCDGSGEPWWVVADVCAVLGYANPRDVVSTHVREHQKGVANLDTPGGRQALTMINEGGLYRLIMRSGKPDAEQFQDWVTDKVIPSIRKTGSYSVAQRSMSQIDVLIAALEEIKVAQNTAAEAKEIARVSEAWLDAIEGRHEWFAALGYAKVNGLATDALSLQRLGVAASKAGRAQGITPNRIQHALYGAVNHWPAWVWDAAVESLNGSL